MKKRLESLDVLRGADLFFLMAVGPVVRRFIKTLDVEWLNNCYWLFDHVEWQGFSPWDIIMPLFVFMTGITIPFALGRMREEHRHMAYCPTSDCVVGVGFDLSGRFVR